MVMVNGTERNIPTGPKINPQNRRDRNTTSVDKPNPFPMILGSTKFPRTLLISINEPRVHNAPLNPSCTRAKRTAGTAAMIDPIFGMHYPNPFLKLVKFLLLIAQL
jgi:hypothetical protein